SRNGSLRVAHHDHVASASHRFFSERRQTFQVAFGPPIFHLKVAALGVAERAHSFDEGAADLCHRRGRASPNKGDPRTLGRRLGACHERPRGRATEQRDELAALHSITSSARAKRSPRSARGAYPSIFVCFS